MHIPLGIFEPPKTEATGSRPKPVFRDSDRPRRDELDEAILSGKLPTGTAELRRESEYNPSSLLSRAGL